MRIIGHSRTANWVGSVSSTIPGGSHEIGCHAVAFGLVSGIGILGYRPSGVVFHEFPYKNCYYHNECNEGG